jgi:hypothetical protein
LSVAFATVLCDANVLYPAPLRDLLVRLAISAVIRVHWTEHIHEEWMRSVLADRPDLARAQLERTRALMDAAVQNSLIRDYEHRIEELELPDADDRHILPAAIVGGVQRILTFNTKDFPAAVVAPFGIDVQDPDSSVPRAAAAEGVALPSPAGRWKRAASMPSYASNGGGASTSRRPSSPPSTSGWASGRRRSTGSSATKRAVAPASA